MKKFYLVECGTVNKNDLDNYMPEHIYMFDNKKEAKEFANSCIEENYKHVYENVEYYAIIIKQDYEDNCSIVNHFPHMLENGELFELEFSYEGELSLCKIKNNKGREKNITKKQYDKFVDEVIFGPSK